MMDRKLLPLRISLALAIVAMVAVFAAAWLKIRPRMQTLSKEREQFKTSSEQNRARATKIETFARELTARLADAEAQTASALQSGKVAADQNRRFLIDLEEARAKLHSANQELARWNATGATPDQAAALARDNKVLAAQLAQLQTNQARLVRELAHAKGTLDDPADAPELPPLHASVLVVDPKWDFVVLDLGDTNGLLKDRVLMISRDGKLISKVKVRHVGPERSIADILPGWRVAQIREGDQVMN